MFFEYPYSDMHELNLDWFLKKFKELVEEWNQVQDDWTSLHDYVQNYFDNLNVQTEIDNKINAMILDGTFADIVSPFVTAALPALVAGQLPDVVAAQISTVVAAQISAVVADQLPAIAASAAAAEVGDWLAAHIDPDTGYVIDDTLTVSQAAADAKTVGDNLDILTDKSTLLDGYVDDLNHDIFHKKVIDGADFTIGDLDASGEESASTTRSRTGFLTGSKKIYFSPSPDTAYKIFGYDANKENGTVVRDYVNVPYYVDLESYPYYRVVWYVVTASSTPLTMDVIYSRKIDAVDMDHIKSLIDQLTLGFNTYGFTLMTGMNFHYGSINSSGTIISNTTRIYSDKIIRGNVDNVKIYPTSDIFDIRVCQYKSDDTYISTSTAAAGNQSISLNANCGYIRLVAQLHSNPGNNITPDLIYNAIYAIHINPKSDPVHVKVCSYNVGHYNMGFAPDADTDWDDVTTKYRKFFSNLNADILGICEDQTTYGDFNSGTAIYDYLYPYQKNSTNWTCLKSRYQIIEAGEGTFVASNRKYVYGYININGKKIFIMTLHFGLYKSVRDDEYTELLAILSDKEYFIVFGDFNAGTNGEGDETEYNPLISAGYHLSNNGYLGLFNTYVNTNNRYLDNIVTSNNIIIANTFVAADNAGTGLTSDHLPIVSELIIL